MGEFRTHTPREAKPAAGGANSAFTGGEGSAPARLKLVDPDVSQLPTGSRADASTSTDSRAARMGPVKRAAIASGTVVIIGATAACGGGPSPEEGGADPNLTTYTAVCAKPYTREGLTRWQEVQMDQSPRPGAESERLQEVVADGNDDASEWYQPFERQSNDRNKMPIVWPCKPGTSVYELDPGSNGAYLNPGAVEAQDPTAMRYVNRTHGDS